MNLGTVDYSSTIPPFAYRCGGCGASHCKLWREYQTCADYTVLLCCDCAAKRGDTYDVSNIDESGYRPGDCGDTDQIGWCVPAVPTKEGDTFWGYSSVPEDGCVWWRHLPTRTGGTAGGNPKREAQIAARNAEALAIMAKWEANRPPNLEIGDCRSVVIATHTEQLEIWCRNAADAQRTWTVDGFMPGEGGGVAVRRVFTKNTMKWEAQSVGRCYTIGELAGFPICICIFFAKIDGEPVAFVEATSRVVDHEMVRQWIKANAKPDARVTDAMNWRNALWERG